MRVMVCESQGVVRLAEVAAPVIQAPTDVILKVRATTICGSDISLIHGHIPTPWGFELGHEYVGEVVEIGAAVTGVAVGDRVVGPAAPWCGCCEQCRKGREGKRPLRFVREARKRARTEAKREIRENIN